MQKKALYTLFLLLIGFAYSTYATETKLIVRVKAKDAKFIGSSMGGALVMVRDSETGQILAKGLTKGSTGNTKLIMYTTERGVALSDEATAKFETTLDIDEPQLVTIEASGPYSQRQSMATSTAQVWLIPGKDIVGDGVILEVPGFAIDILAPQAHERISLNKNRGKISITINMVMM